MSGGEIVEIALAQVYAGPLVRAERLDLDHVATLRGVETLPPIDVRKTAKGYECLDGAHRTAAHRADGLESIRAVVLELDDAEALEHAYLANNRHGMPLTLSERKAGARRFISTTTLSDASIAKVVGLTRNTVASLRPVQPAQNEQVGRREGKDGKQRPASKADIAAQRAEVAKILAEHPDLSLNEVARRAGCSPMTAASVRTEINKARQPEAPAPPAGSSPTPPSAPRPAEGGAEDGGGGDSPKAAKPLAAVPPSSADTSVGEVIDWWPADGQWSKTEQFQASNAARDFARFMDRRLPRQDEPSAAELAAACPAEMRRPAALAARAAAARLTDLADLLDRPARLTSVEGS